MAIASRLFTCVAVLENFSTSWSNVISLSPNDFLSRAGHEQNREAPAAFHGVGSKKLLGSF